MKTPSKHGIIVGMYVCRYVCMYVYVMYHWPAFVAPWFSRSVYTLKCSIYWRAPCTDVLMCVVYNCIPLVGLNSKEEWSLDLLVVCCEDYWRRQVGECADTWYKWIEPIERLELFFFSCLATSQRACVKPRWLMGWLYCCFVTFISTKAQHWTLY